MRAAYPARGIGSFFGSVIAVFVDMRKHFSTKASSNNSAELT